MTGVADRLRGWVPRWWRGEAGAVGRAADAALAPAEGLFRLAAGARNLGYDRGWLPAATATIPVISVGNVGVGGAGKTPFAAWLARRLAEWEARPAIVLRGYGSDEIAVHQELNPGIPVVANADRAAAARAAAERGCTVAILDDGFQHRALRRDLDLVLVGVESWTERRRLLPRGPWREPISALRRASLVVLTRKTASEVEAEAVEGAIRAAAGDRPIVHCRIEPAGLRPLHPGAPAARLDSLRGAEVLAVASLADPRPFADHLRGAGAMVELAPFPDHHDFTPGEARELVDRAAGRTIVMTRKEAVKLRPLLAPTVQALVLDQEVSIEAGLEVLVDALRELVDR